MNTRSSAGGPAGGGSAGGPAVLNGSAAAILMSLEPRVPAVHLLPVETAVKAAHALSASRESFSCGACGIARETIV